MARNPKFRQFALRISRGVLILGGVTFICYRAHLHDASTALLLLIAVVLQSLDCTFLEAAVLSLLATASLDYFFTDPVWSFTVSGPLESMTLVCMLTVALVITRIQSRSRAESKESDLQRANMESLYKVSRNLLALTPPIVAGPALLEPILSAFDLAAVGLYDALTLESFTSGKRRPDLEARTRECFIIGESASYPEVGIEVQPLRTADRIYGSIGFVGLRDPSVTAPALAAMAVAALERGRAFRSATSAAVYAEAETLRSALLDALAHEFKTPLATILAAAGGIREGGTTVRDQAELAETIETEASRLGDLTTRLLRLARVDREDLKPRLRATDAAELTQRTIHRYAQITGRVVSFHELEEVGDVRVDPELIGLAISQLVENACRYSSPDTDVRVELGIHDGLAAITVWNAGPPIAASERERIFERFFRGSGARQGTPGSGLGLYVARKITRAHAGDVVLLDDKNGEVGFRLTLPLGSEVSGAGRLL